MEYMPFALNSYIFLLQFAYEHSEQIIQNLGAPDIWQLDRHLSLTNNTINQSINGNTNTVYINPINSLKFVLTKLKKDKIKLNKNFYVFTGSSVGVVPILGKGIYKGVINKLGSVTTKIN